jgi:hypothetical protein
MVGKPTYVFLIGMAWALLSAAIYVGLGFLSLILE